MQIFFFGGGTFAGVKRASNESGVVKNGDFCFFLSLYLPKFNYSNGICSPVVTFSLTWK